MRATTGGGDDSLDKSHKKGGGTLCGEGGEGGEDKRRYTRWRGGTNEVNTGTGKRGKVGKEAESRVKSQESTVKSQESRVKSRESRGKWDNAGI